MFILCILLTLFRNVMLIDFSGASPDNFGPFAATWHHHNICRGPKSKNDTLFQAELETDGESYWAIYNITAYTVTRLEKIKISVSNVKAGVKQSVLWNYKLENPCQHISLGALLESNFGTKNCVIKKGLYQFRVNYTSLVHDFLGTSFFYGEFVFKGILLSKTGNIGCVSVYTVFSKLV